MKFTTSRPFTRGLQGKHWQTYRQAVLFPVAAPLQKPPSVSGVGMFPQHTGWWNNFPYLRKHTQHLIAVSVGRNLLQSPAPGRRLGRMLCIALWRTRSPSPTSLWGVRKPTAVGSVKSVSGNPTPSSQGHVSSQNTCSDRDGSARVKPSCGSPTSAMGEGLALVAPSLRIRPIFTAAAAPTRHRCNFLSSQIVSFLAFSVL